MTDREINLRSVLFLVIGILLLLSLVICVFIVGGESDLIETEAIVETVTKKNDGSGKADIVAVYTPVNDSQSIAYKYVGSEDTEVGSLLKLYYHSNETGKVQTFKTSKLIFICPIIGLIICIIGLIELFKKNTNLQKVDYKTSVIGVTGDTRQLKIITDDVPAHQYEKTPEEIAEAQVKTIKKELENIKPIEPIPVTKAPVTKPVTTSPTGAVVQGASHSTVSTTPVNTTPVQNQESVSAPVSNSSIQKEEVKTPIEVPKVQVQKELSVPKVQQAQPQTKNVPSQTVVQQATPAQQPISDVKKDNVVNKQDNLVNQIQEAAKVNPNLGEEDIKNMIKDVLKEVISEVQTPASVNKVVEQKRVLPNYFYISGTSLIYEESGKEAKEMSLKTIKSVTRTINSDGNVVKLVVANDEIKCVLTNMKNIDLEQVANLLHNKLSTIDENFNEIIEHKEY